MTFASSSLEQKNSKYRRTETKRSPVRLSDIYLNSKNAFLLRSFRAAVESPAKNAIQKRLEINVSK
jgi:hypothetical protein